MHSTQVFETLSWAHHCVAGGQNIRFRELTDIRVRVFQPAHTPALIPCCCSCNDDSFFWHVRSNCTAIPFPGQHDSDVQKQVWKMYGCRCRWMDVQAGVCLSACTQLTQAQDPNRCTAVHMYRCEYGCTKVQMYNRECGCTRTRVPACTHSSLPLRKPMDVQLYMTYCCTCKVI